MTRPDYRAVLDAAKAKNALVIWAIFDKPADFPELFVLNVMVTAALLLPPDNVDILFVCADDETKGAVMKALNVTRITP